MRQLQKQFYYAEITFGILTLIAGVLLHFLYEWTGYNYLVSIIAPVNESTWEHLKLLFFLSSFSLSLNTVTLENVFLPLSLHAPQAVTPGCCLLLYFFAPIPVFSEPTICGWISLRSSLPRLCATA